jgi:hypothetical protein
MSTPDAVCNGCTRCAMRCTDGILISEFEYTRIVEALQAQEPALARRVLEQDKQRLWGEDTTYTACQFLDLTTELCLVYPARPLVCRLFGRVAHLPCPAGLVPADLDAARVLEAYTRQPLQTFQAWLAQAHCFDVLNLLATPDDAERYEM